MSNFEIDHNLILPKRSTRKLGGFSDCEPRNYISNFYGVSLQNVSKIYVYEAKFPPEIPLDSSQVFTRCIYQLRAELRKSVGFICFSGRMIYGSKENLVSLTYQAKVESNIIEVQLKHIKMMDIDELLYDPKTRPSVFQFLNSKLKSCLRHANICELGKAGQFFQKDQLVKSFDNSMQQEYHNLEAAGLNVLRGYKFTLMMLGGSLKLQLDVCSRVLQRRNLQEDLL